MATGTGATAASSSEGMRNRKKPAKKQTKEEKEAAVAEKKESHRRSAKDKIATTSTPVAAKKSRPYEDETLWETFIHHPLVIFLSIAIIPYSLYKSYYFWLLQRPDILTTATAGLWKLRPALQPNDTRQLLLVGSLGTLTGATAEGLSDILGLEISHESTNPKQYFCRDGTVSNVLGMRFVSKPTTAAAAGAQNDDNDEEFANRNIQLETVMNSLCFNKTQETSKAFHPKLFRPVDKCEPSWIFPDAKKQQQCLLKECLAVLLEEWGCDAEDTSGSQMPCPYQFQRVLWQIQHPVRTIQEITAQMCPSHSLHPSFRELASVFVPAHVLVEPAKKKGAADGNNETSASSKKRNWHCMNVIGTYVLRYYQTMMAALQRGVIHNSFFMETVTLCEIAEKGGFVPAALDAERLQSSSLSSSSVLYPSSVQKVARHCQPTAAAKIPSAQQPLRTLLSNRNKTFPAVKGLPSDLEQSLKELTVQLGYEWSITKPDDVAAWMAEKASKPQSQQDEEFS